MHPLHLLPYTGEKTMTTAVESQQARVLIQLRDLILKGEFGPGERLAEIPLADRLNASRTPVRLALSTLEYEGLIEPSPSGGYQMRGYTAKEVSDAIQARGVLEGFAARLLAEQGAPRSLLRELHDCLRTGDEAVDKPLMEIDDYAAYAEMNTRFHAIILEGCGSLAVARMIDLPPVPCCPCSPRWKKEHSGCRWRIASITPWFKPSKEGKAPALKHWAKSTSKSRAVIWNMPWIAPIKPQKYSPPYAW
jgi:DNA-binding GntR family transcriptional regulator